MNTPSEQAILFVNAPGFQGSLARLLTCWDITRIEPWLAGELVRGTPPEVIAKVIGEVVAAAVVGTIAAMPAHIDKLGFLNSDLGILGQIQARIEKRLITQKSDGGIILADALKNGG